MLRRTSPALLLALALIAGAALAAAGTVDADAQAADGVTGTWEGAIGTPPPLEVAVRLQRVDDAWEGTIDIPAQGALGLPLEDVAVAHDEIRFVIAGLPGAPTFEGVVDGDRMEGTFTQGGQSFPFELERTARQVEAEPPAREEQLPAEAAPAAPGPGPVPADPSAVAAPDDVHEDPQGRFSVPVPAGWTVEERDTHVELVSPDGGIRLSLLTLEEEDLEAAVEEAWARVDPAFDLAIDDTLEPPSDPGVERTLFVDYDSPPGRIHQAVAQLHEGLAHVLLVDASLEAAQRRGAQINIVLTGHRILALEEPDLTGIEPRAATEVVDELEAFVHEALDAVGIPGAVVAVVQDDEVVYAQGFGVRNGAGEPITADTHMMIGSTGKTITTMLMAVLVDEGLFDWDTPVVEVLPPFQVADPELTREMTMWNLVCACSGVPRRDLELLFNADELTAEDVVESLAAFEFFTDFGEVFQYSNQLVGTGGFAAAAADGADWGELWQGYAASLAERVLEPIGMVDTTLSFAEVRDRGEHALPHQLDLETGAFVDVPLEVERLLVPIAPAGSHWSTANDMARYMITQLGRGVAPGGARVVSEEELRRTWEPGVPVTATDSYGLGWFVGEYRGLDLLYHGGNTLGFTSDFAFLPEVGIGVLVLTNAQGTNVFNSAVRTRVFELVFDQPAQSEEMVAFGVAQREQALATLQEDLRPEVDEDAVAPYLGTFVSPMLGPITLTLEAGELVLDAGEFQTVLQPSVDDEGEVEHYLAMEGPVATAPFEFTEVEGELVIVLGEGLQEYTFVRAD